MVNNFYVYEHTRPDTGAVFYVGKGSGNRSHKTSGRNRYWKRVVSKAGGFVVRIIADGIDEELAFLVERERINQLRLCGRMLVNFTDGGEGTSGLKHSDESKALMSMRQKGIQKPPMTDETKRKLSEAKKGRVYGRRTKEWCENISKALTGRKRTPEECANISKAKKGAILSDEVKAKMSVARLGEKNHMYGKAHTESAIKKMRSAILSRTDITCPHCGKTGSHANMHRWHLDNCKHRKDTND